MSNSKMRWLFFLLFLGHCLVDALSSSGNRLLVVLEDLSEQDRYSTFFKDLEGKKLYKYTPLPKIWGNLLIHIYPRPRIQNQLRISQKRGSSINQAR